MSKEDNDSITYFQAIIFDLDGTLLNTLDDIADSVNRMLAEEGLPTHTVDAYRFFIGNGWRMLVTRALPEDERSDERIDACVERSREIYHENWNRKTRVYEGIADLMDRLQERGLPLAVLSNKPHDFALRYAGAYLGQWKFEAILGYSDRFPPKPDPTAALEIAGRIDVAPENFLFVGDSAVDMQTAHAAGMHAVGTAWGFRGAGELRDNGCRTLVRHPLEILPLLDLSHRPDP
ncbi:HAD-IA family hydrolase [Breoghania sp.]|uniref:HAD family hydrolase n=1 Tax=Breoghania sp. TaxID=2065378 RepID=UPI0029C7A8B0|nr:HAD-IA family hydrolase [Breoghania sp.]